VAADGVAQRSSDDTHTHAAGLSVRECPVGNLYGLRDPRYIAVLGGMLFMDQKFSEAKEVFDKANDIGFQFEELTRLQFFPHVLGDRATRVRLEGTVVSVKAGYAFVSAPGYPDFFCYGTKFGRLSTDAWMKVTFEPAFCARGPCGSCAKSGLIRSGTRAAPPIPHGLNTALTYSYGSRQFSWRIQPKNGSHERRPRITISQGNIRSRYSLLFGKRAKTAPVVFAIRLDSGQVLAQEGARDILLKLVEERLRARR
jgi:hypothetical protein